MKKRRQILESFSWKKNHYYKGGSIIEENFSDIELKVLENLGKIVKEEKPSPPEKKKKTNVLRKDKDKL